MRRHQMPTLEQTEPCGPDSGQALQFLDGRLDDVPVLLSTGHAFCDGLHGEQPSRALPRLIKHQQQHTQTERNLHCQEGWGGYAVGEQ